MKFRKILIVLCSVLFFICALTLYLNRIIFPQLIKKIAIERIEEIIKRKVEIGSIRFSWVRGFIIDKIKIYESGSRNIVFAQADQVAFGIIIIPEHKHYRITIPFIDVRSPSVRLIRSGDDTWNFSDLYAPRSPASPTTDSSKKRKLPAFEIAWGGIAISDGKCLVNDISNGRQWSEFFDNINLKLSLSYKGISYDFNADIPSKNGFVGATVYYQPLSKNTQAQIRLKNIDTASYLSLINIPDVHLESGLIKDIRLDINHTQTETSAQGDVSMQHLNITNQGQTFKGDIEIHDLNAHYQDGSISAKGKIALNDVLTKVPGLSAGGSVQARVNDFEFSPQGTAFDGSLESQHLFVNLKDRQVRVDEVVLDDIKIKKDNNGIQSVGSIKTQGLFVRWPSQQLQGDLALKNVTMRIKNEDDIALEGDLTADHFMTSINDKYLSSRHLVMQDIQLRVIDQKDVALNTQLSINDMRMVLGKKIFSSASLKTDKVFFNVDDGILKASSTFDASGAKFFLDKHKTIEGDPQLELNIQMPVDNPQALTYKGSITVSDASLRGFAPFQTLDNVELDADFQNNEATLNALSINILDTNVHVSGTITNFANPYLDITADADDLNLAKMGSIAPDFVHQYGLSFNGNSFVKVKFEGLAFAPLQGKILAVASVKNVSVTSSKFHQRLKNITGILEATPNSLIWRDFTATYQGQHYSFAGSLHHFNHPKILFNIEGSKFYLNADLSKDNDLITINSLTGKFYNAAFDSAGSIALYPNEEPFININASVSLLLEDIIKNLPVQQQKNLQALNPTATIRVTADLQGRAFDWKNYSLKAIITSPMLTLLNYKLTDLKININQHEGRINHLTMDGKFYEGIVHAVGSLDLLDQGMPYDLAFNIDNADLHELKMDSPLRMNELDGKFFFTSIMHGQLADFKNNLHATGSVAIRDGFLGEFNLFKGVLDVLNDAMDLGKVVITDAEANFTIDEQKIHTDNLRLKGPTIVLLGKGWVDFNQTCDLNMTVDLSSGAVPALAHDVLKTLNIRIYDKISNPKFGKKISVPQVINTLFKNLLQ